MAKDTRFHTCSICGKMLIEQKGNGVMRFLFGDQINGGNGTVVELEALGLVRMRCIRRSCRKQHPNHWNQFDLFEISQPPVATYPPRQVTQKAEETPATVTEEQFFGGV